MLERKAGDERSGTECRLFLVDSAQAGFLPYKVCFAAKFTRAENVGPNSGFVVHGPYYKIGVDLLLHFFGQYLMFGKYYTLLYILLFGIMYSCSRTDELEAVIARQRHEIYSLRRQLGTLKNSPELTFMYLVRAEQHSKRDTLLLPAYRELVESGGVVGSYAMGRIYSINRQVNKNDFIDQFEGNYVLKPLHKKHLHRVTTIELKSDSIFLHNEYGLVTASGLNLVNTSDEYKAGEIFIDDYVLQFIKPGMILAFNKRCNHCNPLKFIPENWRTNY